MTTVDTASPTAPSAPATRPTRDRILDAALQESVHAGGPVADPAPKALIAVDGVTEIRTPHDDCLMVMPCLRPGKGHTAVRLARFVT